jgi:hypothetical protein
VLTWKHRGVPDYDLTRLGSRAFEQMVVALCRSELGPGMQVFGDGPDGGREATFNGTIRWASTVFGVRAAGAGSAGGPAVMATAAGGTTDSVGSAGLADSTADDVWTGYTVIQSKFKLDPAPRPHDNAVWIQGQIRHEIANWVKAAKDRTRTRLPDYLIFVTNVGLSSVAMTGGIDTVAALVAELLGPGSEAEKVNLHVRAFKIWHGDQVRLMIDAHQDVRWAFDGLLTVGDVLAALQTGRSAHLGSNNIQDPLREDLVAGLAVDRWIRLGQAGGSGDAKLYLDDVVIDVPATVTASAPGKGVGLNTATLAAEGTLSFSVSDSGGSLDVRFARTVRAVGHVLARGDTVLSARQSQQDGPPGVVLVGGPGQGKTTLSQLVAQAYRAALLDDADLAPSTRAQVDATKAALGRLGMRLPRNRRWPVRVDLAKYAEELASGAETSLLRWVSQLVTRRAAVEVTPARLNSWLGVSPWVVVLDGLDEVPSLDVRIAVYDQVEQFWTKVDDLGADVLMVVTTRPTGYDERLPDDRFEHLHLQQLPPEDSGKFAQRLTAKRFEGDDDMRSEVAARMRAAAADPTTARLMGTPLQVTIMSMIVEKYPTLPPDRYTLFDLYYVTVLEREIAKGIAVSRFLSDYRQHIDRLHERVGLTLQVQSESADSAEAVLAPGELRRLASDYMLQRGFEPEQAASTANRLVAAALTRLVLLVPRDDGLGFEIRTLQELMAARAIVEGTDAQAVERLRLLADSPHWRNTWLLAAGKLLVNSDRFESVLVDLLRSLGQDIRPHARVSPAPEIAADMLIDGLAQRRPALERGLARTLLTARDEAAGGQVHGIANALNTLMDSGYRQIVLNHLSAASGFAQRAAAATLLDVMEQLLHVDEAGRRQSIRLARSALNLSEAEYVALSAFVSLAHPAKPVATAASSPVAKEPTGFISAVSGAFVGDQSVTETLLGALVALELDDDVTTRLVEGLAVLAPVRFRLTTSEPPLAVLRSAPVGNPRTLLDILTDEDLTTALELALGGLPAGYWALPALVATTVHLGRSRRSVGGELEGLMAAPVTVPGPL